MPRRAKKYHFIYKTTNKINGKYYYGMHSTDNLEDGYIGSGKRLWYSIRKYGKDNFIIERLEFFDDRERLCEAEKILINDVIIKDPLCMNLKLGGEGGGIFHGKNGFCNPEVARKGRLKVNKILHERYNTDEKYRNMVNTRSHAGLVEKYKTGWRPWKDKKHKQESKDKIGKANAIHQIGEGNSQYGKCWITKDGTNKMIKKEELKTYTDIGWIKGRKI